MPSRLPSGANAGGSSGGGLSSPVGIADMSAQSLERGFVLGKAGAIGATETDAADFYFICPFNATLLRMKTTLRTAASGAMTVQLRTAAGPITSTVTWGNVSGFVTTYSASNYVAVVDPANVNVAEGDLLGFSCGTGSGTDLLVEVVAVLR